MGLNGLGKAGQLLFSVVKIDKSLWDGGMKEVAIHSQGIQFNCSSQPPTSSTPQSNNNDVGDGNGNNVVGNKEGNGKGGKSNGNGNKEGR